MLLETLLDSESKDYARYESCVRDLLENGSVCSMAGFPQHGRVSCLAHCVRVSYRSYRLCGFLRLDACAAARGGLLHDLFLYDWHEKDPARENHATCHAGVALKNAMARFALTPREQDIIRGHMWPVNFRPPRYPETYLVSMMDKLCTIGEVLEGLGRSRKP